MQSSYGAPRLEQQVRAGEEASLHQQVCVVPTVEDPHAHIGVELLEAPNLAVLSRHELLTQRRQLDEEIVLGKVEVGAEGRGDPAVLVPAKGELNRLVLPSDPVEIKQFGETLFRLVRKARATWRWCRLQDSQG